MRWSLGVAGVMVLLLAIQLGPLRAGMGGTPLLGFPIHHDDFRNLSYTDWEHLPRFTARPVSTLVLVSLSIAGTRVYYASLHLLLVAYVALVLSAMRRLFPARGWPAVLATGAAAVAALLFERVPEYWLYSGMITNLVSGVTAVGALLALDVRPASRAGRAIATAAGLTLFAASILAKEDFALATVVALALRALDRRRDGDRSRWRHDLLVLGAVVAASVVFLGWSLSGRPTFLRAPGDTYRPDFSGISLIRTTLGYLTCTTGARIASAVQLGLLALLAVTGHWRATARAAGVAVVTLALVAPYAALPRHVFPFYAFNWTVWQAATLLVLGPLLASSRRALRVLIAGAVVVGLGAWVTVTQPTRAAMVRWFAGETARNRRIIHTLDGLRESLRPWPVVGVTGVMPLNPWFGNDGAFLRNRLGLPNRWVVFADDEYLQRSMTLLQSLQTGSIEVREVARVSESGLPLLVLAPDGSGSLVLPAAVSSADRLSDAPANR